MRNHQPRPEGVARLERDLRVAKSLLLIRETPTPFQGDELLGGHRRELWVANVVHGRSP